MSGKFSGFTEEDIIKAQNNKNGTEPDKNVAKGKKSQKVVIRVDSARRKILESKAANEEGLDLPKEAKLSETQQTNIGNNNIKEEPEEQKTLKEEELTNNNLEKPRGLDEIQSRQKLIEEQNNRRKELLTRALADRTKRTQEEAKRLNEIQEEFKKLDAVLSNDVRILRKKIELASLDYMEAQKRYLRIENMFLSAKLNLQKQLEKKEMLTEHLCTIIEQNEERKAAKLTELINKLNLDDAKKDEEETKST